MSDSSDAYKNQRDKELRAISGNESNYGQNTKHGIAKYGPTKGQRAIGTYAFMPGTLSEVEKRSDDPRLSALKKMSMNQLAEQVRSHPELEKAFAEDYYDEIYKKHPNDPDARAASWLMGPNRSDSDTHDLMERLPAVQKYVDDFHKHEGDRLPASAPFNKINQMVSPKQQAPIKLPGLGETGEELPGNLALEAPEEEPSEEVTEDMKPSAIDKFAEMGKQDEEDEDEYA
jgi:hypothetical protein